MTRDYWIIGNNELYEKGIEFCLSFCILQNSGMCAGTGRTLNCK